MKSFAGSWFSGRGELAVLLLFALLAGTASADDGHDSGALADNVATVFHRSMTHWQLDYNAMPDRKAGVACVPWSRIDMAFLDKGIFDALGFSYSMAEDSGAINVATQGCNRMKAHYKVKDCVCEVVLLNDSIAVKVPAGAGE